MHVVGLMDSGSEEQVMHHLGRMSELFKLPKDGSCRTEFHMEKVNEKSLKDFFWRVECDLLYVYVECHSKFKGTLSVYCKDKQTLPIERILSQLPLRRCKGIMGVFNTDRSSGQTAGSGSAPPTSSLASTGSANCLFSFASAKGGLKGDVDLGENIHEFFSKNPGSYSLTDMRVHIDAFHEGPGTTNHVVFSLR